MEEVCAANTKSGRPCENPPGPNGLCRVHDDGSVRGRCKANTAAGKRCRNKAVLGGLCPAHDGLLEWRQQLNRRLRSRGVRRSEPASDFVPANQRGAVRDEKGRLRVEGDWSDRTRGLPIVTKTR